MKFWNFSEEYDISYRVGGIFLPKARTIFLEWRRSILSSREALSKTK